MRLKLGTKSPLISFTLVALAISLIVNFSYMLLMVVNQSSEIKGSKNERHNNPVVVVEGVLGLSVDGFGYLVDNKTGDSIYGAAFQRWNNPYRGCYRSGIYTYVLQQAF